MCELTAQALGCATTDVLVCQTGLIGIPMPMDPVESGIPKLGAELTDRRRRRAAAADAMLTTDTVRKQTHQPVELADAGDRDHRRHGQGRGDAGAGDGHDARGAHHRRRGRSRARSSALLADRGRPTASTRSSSTRARAPTTPCSCSPTARPATSRSRRRRASPTPASARRSTAACADLAHQMAADAEGATKLVTLTVRGARNAAEARQRGARRREQPARAVLALRQGPVLGPDPLRARRERRGVRSRAGRDRLRQGVTVCRDGIAAPHDAAALAAAHDRARRRDRLRPARPATARRRCCSPTSRTRTSTRTWARRDECGASVRGRGIPGGSERRRRDRRRRSSPRRCRTSASSRARPS